MPSVRPTGASKRTADDRYDFGTMSLPSLTHATSRFRTAADRGRATAAESALGSNSAGASSSEVARAGKLTAGKTTSEDASPGCEMEADVTAVS